MPTAGRRAKKRERESYGINSFCWFVLSWSQHLIWQQVWLTGFAGHPKAKAQSAICSASRPPPHDRRLLPNHPPRNRTAARVTMYGKVAPLALRMTEVAGRVYRPAAHPRVEGKAASVEPCRRDRFSSIILHGPPGGQNHAGAHHQPGRRNRASSRSAAWRAAWRTSGEAGARAAAPAAVMKRPRFFWDDSPLQQGAAGRCCRISSAALRFIGATTHNPFFTPTAPLVSRSQVFQLEPLGIADLEGPIDRALTDFERGPLRKTCGIDADARLHLATVADGDARRCLNALELAVLTTSPDAKGEIVITLAAAEERAQQKTVVYDGDGDAHYDTISAFIKSMRASDPDATLYWLAKMLHAGEDIRFIVCRIVIAASEDVGMADSNALVRRRGRAAGRGGHRHAGGADHSSPRRRLQRHRAEEQSRLHGHRCRLEGHPRGTHAASARHLRDGHYKGAKQFGNGEGYLTRTTTRAGLVRNAAWRAVASLRATSNGLEARIKESASTIGASQWEAAGKPEAG